MYPAAEFNAACGPLEGAHEDGESNGPTEGQRSGRRSTGSTHPTVFVANDLRKKLLKTTQEKSVNKDAGASVVGSRAVSPMLGNRSPNPDEEPSAQKGSSEVWVQEAIDPQSDVRESACARKPIFVNTTFYTLLRLLQLLYSRLLMCKEIGARLAAQKHVSFRENPIAEELGLADPNGPSAVLAQAIEAVGDNAIDGANVVYMYLLDACEKVFDNELDQVMFEEHMRWFFGSKVSSFCYCFRFLFVSTDWFLRHIMCSHWISSLLH
jgi:paired amphipathic helix protein Sin3a